MFKFKPVVLAVAAALSVTAMRVAGAGTADGDVPKIVVRYDASTLDSDAGVRHLYNQLQIAAERVCPVQMRPFPSKAVLACRKQALTGAVEKIHNTRLAALSGVAVKTG